MTMANHLRFYTPAVSSHLKQHLVNVIDHFKSVYAAENLVIDTEFCYHLILANDVNTNAFLNRNGEKLRWLLSQNPFEQVFHKSSNLKNGQIIEIGPRLSFKTAFCTNALSVFNSAGIDEVVRIERSVRYSIQNLGNEVDRTEFLWIAGDRMTECIYDENTRLDLTGNREDFIEIDVLGDPKNLDKANVELGLAFDETDLTYYKDLFIKQIKRNPTDVELFDLAQSDSEHSRHWFFRGRLFVDGHERKISLMDSVKSTLETTNKNSLIAFNDNSSAIRGFEKVSRLRPKDPGSASPFFLHNAPSHVIYSAETHNFPTAVCPFQGATTGTGGRIRDVHSTGRGAHEIAAVAGYSCGNLHLPDYEQPWEDKNEAYPNSLSHPRQIIIEASNGASDYGNKFGEPVVCGFARTFGMRLPDGSRREYLKPIMFSGGIGSIDDDQIKKAHCKEGQIVAKIGGPVYRIGVGGGAASSLSVQGERENELDFAAVQRGDAEMGAKLHRVVRGCVEYGGKNPILAIHDQGAGGNGNVIKELVEGCGVKVDPTKFYLGDETISSKELWTAEYQESDACLVDSNLVDKIEKVCQREKCQLSLVGTVTKEQRVVLDKFTDSSKKGRHPVDLDTHLIGKRERKMFQLTRTPTPLRPLELPESLSVRKALSMVLRLPSVASKRYLTCKVDRSVTGLIAQQQCVGPLHTPLADVAVVALSHFDTVGGAMAVGEQPIKGLVDPAAGARMTVAETLTNLVFALITQIKDIKMSGNWMWAAKAEGEGAKMVEALDGLCQALKEVGVGIDGGKDSLSMVVSAANELVKAPGTLVLTAYVTCPDIRKVVTPDLKPSRDTSISPKILYVRMGSDAKKQHRLGGSALAQCLKQIGDEVPDIHDFKSFVDIFKLIQQLIKEDKILAGHDVSDGGLITALLEMAFAGNMQVEIDAKFDESDILFPYLFSEEAGVLLEVEDHDLPEILNRFTDIGVTVEIVGFVENIYGPDAHVRLSANGFEIFKEKLTVLREEWEETSDRLGTYQTAEKCLEEAKQIRQDTKTINYRMNYKLQIPRHHQLINDAPKVAILREEGSNGDREMAAAFRMSGFDVFDVTMTDLLQGFSFDPFRGIAFVGGFSYADVLGSAKGWAAAVLYHEKIKAEFDRFRRRNDTFSFGVCNGCQLLTLLGWVGEYENTPSVFLEENKSGRFESFFGPVKIRKSKSIMLKDIEESILGLWASHGEGRFTYRNSAVLPYLFKRELVAVQYCTGEGDVTERYPWNPNGSEQGVAAVCSEDGRHLAMMPHSDRAFLSWQWPDYPNEWKNNENTASPWFKMFTNAYDWTLQH